MPTPMKDSAASVKMASGMPKVIETTMGVSALGSTWRVSTRQPRAPSARAPSTNSFSLRVSTWARVCRAMPTQHGHDEDDEQEPRESRHHVDEASQQDIGAPADEPRQRAEWHADEQDDHL